MFRLILVVRGFRRFFLDRKGYVGTVVFRGFLERIFVFFVGCIFFVSVGYFLVWVLDFIFGFGVWNLFFY